MCVGGGGPPRRQQREQRDNGGCIESALRPLELEELKEGSCWRRRPASVHGAAGWPVGAVVSHAL